MRTPSATTVSAGALFLVGAQAVFLVSSYALHMVIARLLGPSAYGIYGVVFNLVSILFVVMYAGIPQAVARYVGAKVGEPEAIRSRALRLQLGIALLVMAVYALLSWPIALLLADPGLTFYLQVSALSILPYAVYSLWVGYLGGLHLFSRQATATALYGILKMLFVSVLAYVAGVVGALLGLALAPVGALLLALRLTPASSQAQPGAVTSRALAVFAGPVVVFAVSTEAITMLDLFLVKAIVGEELTVGYYTAASTIARVPYFLFISLGTAVLAAMARAVTSGNLAKANHLIRQAVRLVVLMAVPAVAFAIAGGDLVIDLLYSADYAPAAMHLPFLTAGMSLAALFRVCASIESGAGRERTAMAVAIIALLVGLGAGMLLTGAYGARGAALTNVLMGAVAAVLSLAAIVRRYPGALPVLTLPRAVIAALPTVVLARLLPVSAAYTLVALLVGGICYLGALVALREIGLAEVRLLLGMLPGQSKRLNARQV